MKFFDFSNLRGDFFGGLTAGIVALPLALAFGEASGAGPIAGLWGAIFVGFFAALFGGTGSQVSGPTGPMVVVFAGVFGSLAGYPGLVFSTVFFAGLLQILMGLLKFGKHIALVPYPVVSGFMSGIGCIIIALQLSRLFGHAPLVPGTIPALKAIPEAVANPVFPALFVGMIALLIVFLWPKAWVKWFPGPLAALLIGTVISRFVSGIPILGDIHNGLPQIHFPTISVQFFPMILNAIIILAVLGGIDSLLTSLVADNLTHTRHRSNQELIGQGIGNAVAGIFGGVPGAGATMRTVINIHNGGRTKLSGMIHALVLLAIVLVFGPLAGKIPHAVLAGILIKVGYDIVDRHFLRRVKQSPRWDLFVMLLVLGLTVFVDLITAVFVGALFSAVLFVKRMADFQLTQFLTANSSHSDPKVRALLEVAGSYVILLKFSGPLSFAAVADFEQLIRERFKAEKRDIILDFSSMPLIDLSATRAVETIILEALGRKRIYLVAMSPEVGKIIRSFCDQKCISEEMCYETAAEALEAVISSREDLCCLQQELRLKQ